MSPAVWDGTANPQRSLLIAHEIPDTKSQADHAQSRRMTRHPVRMNAFDPLVSIGPATQAGFRGWAVAAALIARLQEVGLSGGIDVQAILGPAISDLGASELEELARQLYGPLMDTSRCLLEHPAERIIFPSRPSCGAL
jgi:hypothetical protein